MDLDTKSRMAGKILALRPTTMRPLVPNETSTADDDLPDIPLSVVPVIMTRKKYSNDIETEKNKATLCVSQQR